MCERADRPTARAGFGSTRSVVRRVRLAMESAAPSPQLQYQLDCQSSREPATVLISRNASKTPASARSSDAAPSTVHTRASTKAGVATLFTSDALFARRGTAVTDCGRGPLAYAPPASGSEFAPSGALMGCARSERPRRADAALTRRGLPTSAIRWRRASGAVWRESSKRSSASVGADAPFRGKGIARPEQPREPKQSWRAQAPHAWMSAIATAHQVCWAADSEQAQSRLAWARAVSRDR